MTKADKKHKIKLIMLILICEYLILKKSPPKTVFDTIQNALNLSFWIGRLMIIAAQPIYPYPKGGLAIVGEKKAELIIKK